MVEATGYYWRVRASNGTVWGQWSAPWKFTTDMDDAAIAEIKNAQFEVYPNPTAGIVQINFDEIVNAIQVKVINSIGQLVELKSFNSASQIDLNLKGNSGVYFIEIHAENGFLGCSLSACSGSLILFKWE